MLFVHCAGSYVDEMCINFRLITDLGNKCKKGSELDCGCVEEAVVFSNSHAAQYT